MVSNDIWFTHPSDLWLYNVMLFPALLPTDKGCTSDSTATRGLYHFNADKFIFSNLLKTDAVGIFGRRVTEPSMIYFEMRVGNLITSDDCNSYVSKKVSCTNLTIDITILIQTHKWLTKALTFAVLSIWSGEVVCLWPT